MWATFAAKEHKKTLHEICVQGFHRFSDSKNDLTTTENNPQVRVNIDATLVAIFRIVGADLVK